ncbi:unnamed protein product [Cylicocyclus nassatus]|uniref:SCP domain-containing protein n=1 Tax=Cylicocyclus nassatus TaxID=53992 RepID=A0AA36H8D1_CYLNA|nr:unnamed protein product [Cylicocyclus nassatus]
MSCIACIAVLSLLPTITYAHTICSKSDKMKDHQVAKFLDMHNYRRAMLAKGEVVKGNGNYMPQGANIRKLTYDCDLEERAIDRAIGCFKTKIALGSGVGENTAQVALSSAPDKLTAIHNGVTSWWKQSRTGPNIGNKVYYRTIHTPSAEFVRMAWATTSKIGCAVHKCSSFYAVVCRYAPSDVQFEEQIYKPGKPCSSCPDSCVDGVLSAILAVSNERTSLLNAEIIYHREPICCTRFLSYNSSCCPKQGSEIICLLWNRSSRSSVIHRLGPELQFGNTKS